jgi:Ankyrin repeats (3 copies)
MTKIRNGILLDQHALAQRDGPVLRYPIRVASWRHRYRVVAVHDQHGLPPLQWTACAFGRIEINEIDKLDPALTTLAQAIAAGDTQRALSLLAASPALGRVGFAAGATRQHAKAFYINTINHYVYGGDTALHVAAAAYCTEVVQKLIAMGADVRARNRRGAEPLHYAADGVPGSRAWNPDAQAASIACLIAAGADPNAVDKSGVAPLHRAVRTRCAAA